MLFIAADDLRADLGAYGHREVRSPHLDALARRGTLFTHAYCQQAVCNPSRASLLTGLRPDQLRVWDLATRFRLTRPDVVTLPQHFKENGYTSVGIGKLFHNETAAAAAKSKAPMADPLSWSRPPTHAIGAHWQDWVVPGDPSGPKAKGDAMQCLDVPDNAYFDGRIAEDACAALRELGAAGKPFFLAVGFWKPHLPFNAPKKYWDLYDRSALATPAAAALPRGAPEIAGHGSTELRGYGGIPKQGEVPADTAAALRHGYYACISFLDAQAGRVLDELRRQGLEDDTIVVFWGDHGFHLGEHGLWAKTSNYEYDARVPLIVAAPGRGRPGLRSASLVELVDLYPTLVELAGLPARPELAGRSFAPALVDPRWTGRDYALTQHPRPPYGPKSTHMGYALRTARHRYVEWRLIGTGELVGRELYDHDEDPGETVNRVEDPAFRSIVEHLAREAAAVARQSGRTWRIEQP